MNYAAHTGFLRDLERTRVRSCPVMFGFPSACVGYCCEGSRLSDSFGSLIAPPTNP